jgi:hypothetical protein
LLTLLMPGEQEGCSCHPMYQSRDVHSANCLAMIKGFNRIAAAHHATFLDPAIET